MEGFYAMYYTGVSGFGHAVFILQDGNVSGADATGGILDGEYGTLTDDHYPFEVKLTVPAGATLVTGQTLPEEMTQVIKANLPKKFGDGSTVPVQTPMGPVNVIFKKLRGLV